MKAYLIVFMLNSFLIYELFVRVTRSLFKNTANKGKIFILFSFLILAVHYLIFIQNKEKNFFDKMEVSRIFSASELKKSYRQIQVKYHPDKIKEKSENSDSLFIELREIHEILSKPESKEIYDKFGSKNDKVTNSGAEDEKKQANLILALAEGALIYGVYFIFSIILTYDENVKASRKWLMMLIVLGVGAELFFYFLKNIQEKDFVDYLFPSTPIFERIEIIRFSIGPIANIIRCAYRNFCKLPFDLVLDQNEQIMEWQQEITKMLGSNNPDKGFVLNKLKQVEVVSREISENIDKEIKKREKENQVGWFKKLLKLGVIFLMIYGVGVNLLGLNQEKEEL